MREFLASGRGRAFLLCAALLATLMAIYVFGLCVPEEALAGSYREAGLAPSLTHPFGTDALGRDLFLRTLQGLSVSLTVGAAASLVSAAVAVLVGIAAASGSRALDALVSGCIDLFMSVPHTILVLLISFALGRGMKGLLVGIAATHWCSLARLIRGEVLQLRAQPYVAVSRRLGKGSGYILWHHLLPHLLPQFLVGLVLLFPHAILHEASVSFLGYGLPPEQPAIGILLSESMRYLSAGWWWPALLPGLTLLLLVLLIDKFGEALRRVLDPWSAQE